MYLSFTTYQNPFRNSYTDVRDTNQTKFQEMTIKTHLEVADLRKKYIDTEDTVLMSEAESPHESR